MIRKELQEISAKKTGFAVSEMRLILDSIIKTIKDTIRIGETVTIEGLGTFKLEIQKPMTRRNLNTGELFSVPEKKKVVFKPSSKIDVNKISVSKEVNQ